MMPYTKRLAAFLSAFLSFIAVCSFGQNTSFNGTWAFKSQESISGRLYSNGSPKTVKISQPGGQTVIEQTSAAQNGDVTTSVTLTDDGKPFETKTASGRKKLVIITWSGNSGFTTVTRTYDTNDSTKLFFTTTDTYTLENGDLVLQRKADNASNGEIWESKAYYNKQ